MLKLRSSLSFLALATMLMAALPAGANEARRSPDTANEKDSDLLLHDHPLADSLWQTANGKKIDASDLASKLSKADYVLLGEKHDNPEHHRIQAELLSMALGADRAGNLVLEMVEPRHEAALADAIIAQGNASDMESEEERQARLAKLEQGLEWEKRGWPAWAMYSPIFASALEAGMTLRPGNPNRDDLMSIGRGGKLDGAMLEDLRWELDYSPEERESLEEELFQSHCEMMPKEAMGPLVTLQRLKDAHMARSMRQGLKETTVSVLIAGNGHVRKDRGVAKFLDQGKKTIAVGIIEVVRDEFETANYPSFDPDLYDYVWFTARLDEDDPCEKFREQLERMKKKMNKTK